MEESFILMSVSKLLSYEPKGVEHESFLRKSSKVVMAKIAVETQGVNIHIFCCRDRAAPGTWKYSSSSCVSDGCRKPSCSPFPKSLSTGE